MKPDAAGAPPGELTPIERLERSRARLRKTWVGKRRPPRRDPQRSAETRPNDTGTSPDAGEESTLDVLTSMLTRWWERHPLRQVSDIAAEVAAPAARSILGSLAERHPLRLVALAAGVDRSYLGGIERGEHNVAVVNLVNIGQCLGLPLSAIFSEAGL